MDAQAMSGSSQGASVGLMALLAGWLGADGASVTFVIISAVAGSSLALSSDTERSGGRASLFVLTNIFVSLALAWALTGLVTSWVPALASDYLPSTIAFMLSFGGKQLPAILDAVISKVKGKVQND